MSSDGRTNRNRKGAGWEYWSARPYNRMGGCPSPRGGKHHKKRTHKAERRFLTPEVKAELLSCTSNDVHSKFGQEYWNWVNDMDNLEIPAAGAEYRYWCERLKLPPLKRGFHKLPEGLIFEL